MQPGGDPWGRYKGPRVPKASPEGMPLSPLRTPEEMWGQATQEARFAAEEAQRMAAPVTPFAPGPSEDISPTQPFVRTTSTSTGAGNQSEVRHEVEAMFSVGTGGDLVSSSPAGLKLEVRDTGRGSVGPTCIDHREVSVPEDSDISDLDSVLPTFTDTEDVDEDPAVSCSSYMADRRARRSHASTRLPDGKEGLLIDTGSRGSLTGGAFIARQSKAAPKGHPTKWERLDKPKLLSGVGDGTKKCTWSATVHGVDRKGYVVSYTAPVIDADDDGELSAVPPLYGLFPMAERNTFMGTRAGVLHEVPEGMEDQIIWPKGTIHRRCV